MSLEVWLEYFCTHPYPCLGFNNVCVNNEDFYISVGHLHKIQAMKIPSGGEMKQTKHVGLHITRRYRINNLFKNCSWIKKFTFHCRPALRTPRHACDETSSKTANIPTHLFSFPLGMTESRSVLFLSLQTYVFLLVIPADAVLFCRATIKKKRKIRCFKVYISFCLPFLGVTLGSVDEVTGVQVQLHQNVE